VGVERPARFSGDDALGDDVAIARVGARQEERDARIQRAVGEGGLPDRRLLPDDRTEPASRPRTNCSTFRRFTFGVVPKLKTGAFRKRKTVETLPSCVKPKPRT
jgi:hypothetical protein